MSNHPTDFLNRITASGLMLLSAATLLFEVNLTRLFSVAQFYHFAFMIVSLALLGFGASGTLLAVFPHVRNLDVHHSIGGFSVAVCLTMLASYVLSNKLPFDSFSIAWDWHQAAILVIHYLALSLPFFFSGLATGLLLTRFPVSTGRIYAYNMTGSALGCAIALAAPVYLGGEGSVTLASLLAALAALCFLVFDAGGWKPRKFTSRICRGQPVLFISIVLFLFCSWDIGSRICGRKTLPVLALNLSPYKSLSYALQYPDATVSSSRWNAISRIDVVASEGIRSLPGISYQFMQSPPQENGLFVDGDDVSPIVTNTKDGSFSAYMPAAIAYRLRPEANSLVLDAHGGLDILLAHHEGASHITAVEPNPLIIGAATHIYRLDEVDTVSMSGRSYINHTDEQFDVIVLSLNNTYHPVNSGAYSLAEDYRYTNEAFQGYVQRLKPDGILVVNRWLQSPPSEFLRAFTLAVTALEKQGYDASSQIVAFRSYNMGTLLVKRRPFSVDEFNEIRRFTETLSFDMVYYAGMPPEKANRFSRLPSPEYYRNFLEFLSAQERDDWLERYPYDVHPPGDDHPFFGHYFKWSQTATILQNLGKSWQPFGGAGYFVIMIFLLLALVMSGFLILLPAVIYDRRTSIGEKSSMGLKESFLRMSYFILIGLGFLLVELPLIQYFILFLDYPAYALTVVLFTLLFFSGLGSRYALHIPRRIANACLAILLISLPWILPLFFDRFLNHIFIVRLALSILLLAPPGFLMGTMFPRGMYDLEKNAPSLISWAWGVNGSASVVASALAALLSLTFGFRFVLVSGALCYTAVCFLVEWIRAVHSP